MYKDIWSPFAGQELDVKIEPMNPRDAYAVATLIDDVVVGHMPIDFSRISSTTQKAQNSFVQHSVINKR